MRRHRQRHLRRQLHTPQPQVRSMQDRSTRLLQTLSRALLRTLAARASPNRHHGLIVLQIEDRGIRRPTHLSPNNTRMPLTLDIFICDFTVYKVIHRHKQFLTHLIFYYLYIAWSHTHTCRTRHHSSQSFVWDSNGLHSSLHWIIYLSFCSFL